jgi:gas vesicle protein
MGYNSGYEGSGLPNLKKLRDSLRLLTLAVHLLGQRRLGYCLAGRFIMLSRNYRNAVRFISGMGAGLTAGCILGLLFAPQAGRRTRRKISSAVEEGVDYVTAKAGHAAKFARKESLRLKNEGKEFLGRGQAALENSRVRMARLHRASR